MDFDIIHEYKNHTELYDETVRNYYDNRILVVNEDINEFLLDDVTLHILKWNQEDRGLSAKSRKPIKIYIDSGGGSVLCANNLIDIIKVSKTPVYAVAFSLVASAASSIYIACDKRYAFDSSVFLLHDGSLQVSNSSNKAKDTMKFFDKMDDKTREFLLSNTKITEEEYEESKDRELYMFSSEAKEKGIVDKIVGKDCSLDEIL